MRKNSILKVYYISYKPDARAGEIVLIPARRNYDSLIPAGRQPGRDWTELTPEGVSPRDLTWFLPKGEGL